MYRSYYCLFAFFFYLLPLCFKFSCQRNVPPLATTAMASKSSKNITFLRIIVSLVTRAQALVFFYVYRPVSKIP